MERFLGVRPWSDRTCLCPRCPKRRNLDMHTSQEKLIFTVRYRCGVVSSSICLQLRQSALRSAGRCTSFTICSCSSTGSVMSVGRATRSSGASVRRSRGSKQPSWADRELSAIFAVAETLSCSQISGTDPIIISVTIEVARMASRPEPITSSSDTNAATSVPCIVGLVCMHLGISRLLRVESSAYAESS